MKSTIQQPNSKNAPYQKLVNILLYLLIFNQMVVLFLISWNDLPISIVWKTVDWSLDRSEINGVAIDGSGEPWFLFDTTSRNNVYQLHHMDKGKTTSWDLPPITFEEAQFVSIAKDKNNNPWLILGKRLAYWDGSQWKFIPMPLDADIKDFICPSVVIKDSIVWGVDTAAEQTRIIQMDINQEPIQAQEITLPDGLDPQEYRFDCIIPGENNGVLAVLSKGVQQVDFYQYQNQEWQKITSFKKEEESYLYVNDVTVDSKGQIWVVLQDWIDGKPVGKFDPKGKIWTWLDMEQPVPNIKYIEYGHIAVDNFGRVWLSATQYGMKGNIFSPIAQNFDAIGVYEESPDGKLVDIRQYTTRNSSLKTSRVSKITIGPDGKIWTWSKQLVWMDGTLQELPQPLPDWFVSLVNPKVMIVFSYLLLAVLIVIQVRNRRRKTAGIPKKL